MQQYLSLVEEILNKGEKKPDRTGTGTLCIFGMQRKYDLRKGFPLLTTKEVKFDSVLRELLWFLRGSTNVNDGLLPHTKIWNPWANENGELGPIYGYQWRKWERVHRDAKSRELRVEHIDQIKNAIELIKRDPFSRRIIVNAWNVADLDRMALPPCHAFFQFCVMPDGEGKPYRLDLQLYQRSADIALGVPFNIASYSCLLMMVAQECSLTPGIFTHTLGDAHIYENHVDGLKQQLQRKPTPLPTLTIKKKPFDTLIFEDFTLENYVHAPFVKFDIAV